MHPLRVICAPRTHCPTCRARTDVGERFRAQAAAAYGCVPADWPACPEGIPMGATCGNCGADWHRLGDCPLPHEYQATDYARDAKGSEGCNCGGE